MNIPTENQYSGCLVGQCLGDTLGFPVEGESQAKCVRYDDLVDLARQAYRLAMNPYL